MNIGQYLLKVLLPVVLVSLVSPVLPWLVVRSMEPSLGRLFITVGVSIAVVGVAVLLIGLDREERRNLMNFIKGNGRKQV